ncbi:MAM and LDL-receptor class A domain-containing protein 1 [Chaetodon auriga]|uniref:MAM and LDL-receptor class A domain-containing protein 1 n=1 Tax=Chaetodon auriga TaxID=39042 RepID=UPI004032A684
MKQAFVLVAVLLVIVSSCPDGDFNCTSRERLPAASVCDFKTDCANSSDKAFCGSCDFEYHSCGWNDTSFSSYNWKRQMANITSIPGLDHTTGSPTGHVMHIDGKRRGSTATLEYSVEKQAALGCQLSFWYHIYDNTSSSSSSLSDFEVTMVRGTDRTRLMHFSKIETDGWEKATVLLGNQPGGYKREMYLQDQNNSHVILKRTPVHGYYMLVSANAYTDVSSAARLISFPQSAGQFICVSFWYYIFGSSIAERECTFQGSLCGMLPQSSADFSWSRITGTAQPANSSGPATDHTLGTDQGYYLSAQLWSHPVGSRCAVMTAVMEPTPPDKECLIFWYYMEGSEVGELSIYLQTPDSERRSAKLWTRSGDQGKHWRHGRVTLDSPDTPYQVIFEAVVGNGPRRDIAIDDLIVLNGACPPPGFCDFEMDYCGWVNNPPAESGVDWDWLSGHFAIFMPVESGSVAQLESEMMEAVDRACLELWHHSKGWLDDRPTVITLTVFVKETAGLRPVWNTTGYLNDTWIQARVDYSASGPHQIILQAQLSNPRTETFSLDDIHIMRDRSCDDSIPTTTPNPATVTTSAPSSAMDCTFEQGLCSWVQEVNDDLNWILSSGLHVEQPWDGPQYDHTVGNNQGFFLLLNGSGSKDWERAVVSVPVSTRTSHICVGFWYHMLGPSVSTLDLLVETKSSEELIWTRRGTQDPEWINAQVTITMNNAIQVMFTGHRNTNSEGFIGLDDITVREGACSNQDVCGFESSLCDLENDVSHSGRWVRERGTEHEVDHTYGTENGFYTTVMKSNSTETEIAQLLTAEFTSPTEICVRFWYWLPAGSSNILAVHVLRSEELGHALWQRSGEASLGWEVAEVTVSSPPKFRVAFKAVHVPGTNSTVRLDDISIRNGGCSPPGSCDFESGQCTWVNIPKEDRHDWVLARGGFQGPPTDHTTQTPEGWFLLSSSLHQSDRSVAQILSEWIQPKDATSCLTLCDSGTLKVYMRSGPSEEDLMFNSDSSGHDWTRFSQSVERNEPFQLLIEAESNNRGFIAIDDISVTPGLCQVNETSLGFVGCSFENGTCDWEDISVGQSQWMRGRNTSETSGPSVDHTVGTELGWYMAVKSDRGDQVSPAAMQSPTMTQASATCTLHFYYNMFGDDSEELNVVLKEGSTTSTLWWLSGNHGDLWHHGEVTVSRVPKDFTILFEASRTFIKPGHIAIDDIDFTNCSLPEPQPFCPENMFLCNSSVCVEHSRVCDFNDDCGDWSDENSCGEHHKC